MTNGDLIRKNLTDERLNSIFCALYEECSECPMNQKKNCCDRRVRMKWLREDVSNEAEKD